MSFTTEIRSKWRLNSLLIFWGLCLGIVLVRLFQVQVVDAQLYESRADAQQARKFEIPASRGQIYVNENGDLYPVALNQKLNMLFADPKFITSPAKAAAQLAPLTGIDQAKLTTQLTYKTSRYVELKQRVSSEEAAKIRALKIPGVVLKPEDYRYYSEASLFSHVLGYVNSDGDGQYGIEQYLNDELTGRNGLLKAATDSLGIPIVSNENTIVEPQNGKSYVLTLDRSIQAVASSALVTAVTENKADSGSIIVMDPNTGAVKAMVNYPDYDPNNYTNIKADQYGVYQNTAVSSLFEPGSGFKLITMAAGIDAGKVKSDTTYNDTGEVQASGKTIRNDLNKKYGVQTMSDVIQKSLNTGVVFVLKQLGGDPNKITRAGKELLNSYIKKFGFGTRTGIEQAGEANVAVKESNSPDVDYANMTFGQGIAVTSIQMIQAVAAIANGGKLYQPYLVDSTVGKDGQLTKNQPKLINDRVISSQAAATVASMSVNVVLYGTAYATKIPGYTIGGKTGTAQIPKPDGSGYYDDRTVGSFVGYAPVEDPKFIILVRIDNPRQGGDAERTAVPAFATVAKALFKYYQIPPKS